jgi:Fe-S-cluster containining protein
MLAPVPRSGAADDAVLLAELAALYREVDALYADWSCPGTTECCRFGVTGRQPYVTSIELAAIRRAIARRGAPLSASKRALPITRDEERERICPMLDRNSRCSIYADRPLGCRTFYCERATQGARATRAELQAIVRKLQELASRHALGGDQARPLTRALT